MAKAIRSRNKGSYKDINWRPNLSRRAKHRRNPVKLVGESVDANFKWIGLSKECWKYIKQGNRSIISK